MITGGKNNISWAKQWEKVIVKMLHVLEKNSALFIIGQWEDTFHKSQHKTQVFLRKEKLEIRKTIKLRVWSQHIWNHFKHFTGRVRCANVQYCQETGGIFPTVCNYSMCVHALNVLLITFKKGYLILKDMWVVAA